MSDDVDDEYVSQSELFDDIDDVYAAFGNDFSMGGTLAGELEEGDSDDESPFVYVGKWPPKPKAWKDNCIHRVHPRITFNEASDFAYEQAKKEARYFVDQLGEGKEGVKKLFDKCFGKTSELFQKCQEHLGMNYLQFSLFLVTFYIECKFSKTYSRLCKEKYNPD